VNINVETCTKYTLSVMPRTRRIQQGTVEIWGGHLVSNSSESHVIQQSSNTSCTIDNEWASSFLMVNQYKRGNLCATRWYRE